MKILILDDLREYVESLSRVLQLDHEVVSAQTLEEAKELMEPGVDAAIVDVRLSEEDPTDRGGLLFLGWMRENYPDVPVIMMSAYRDFDSAVDALNLGAKHFIKKPIVLRELREILDSIAKGGE